MTFTLAAIVAYLAAQLALGVWLSRRIGTEADYLVAGRKLGYGLTTFSMFATWFGAETVVSSGGRAHAEGLSLLSAEPFGYGLCLIGMGLIFAVPLWKRKLTTLADLFRQRYSISVERLAAIILIPSSVLWAAAQVRAFGNVVSVSAPQLDVSTAIGVAAAFTVLYTAFGGLLADAMTDLVQGILLILGLAVLTGAVFLAVGGFDGIGNALESARAARAATGAGPLDISWLSVAEEWAIPVCGSVIATELVGRIVGTKSPEVAKRSSLLAGVMYISVGMMPVFVGMVGGSLVPALADPEQLVPGIARQLLPSMLFALFAGGLISAILSTVDSTLLVASGILSHNLLVPIFGVTDERKKVRMARGGVLAFGIIAYMLALGAEGVFALVEQASALGSAGVLVTVCFALFTGYGGVRAAAATLIVGVVSYSTGSILGVEAPFLLSLAASLLAYLMVGFAERSQTRILPQGIS